MGVAVGIGQKIINCLKASPDGINSLRLPGQLDFLAILRAV